MVHTVLTFAAAEGDEPSKAPFYICGIALVLWALAVSAAGIRSERFASVPKVGRGVMAVSAVLVVATMASAVVSS